MLFKRDTGEDVNNPLKRLGENQRNVNVMAITALGLSLLTLVIVLGMVGGRHANR